MAGKGKLAETFVLNFSMQKVLGCYPSSTLPVKLKARNNKTNHSILESIKADLYEPVAKMVAFYNSVDIIMTWIKALEMFYCDNLSEDYKIISENTPDEWADRNGKSNAVVFEVHAVKNEGATTNTLQYKIEILHYY